MRRVCLAALMFLVTPMSLADPMENAYFLCDVFAKTGVSTDCKVSHLTSTVDVIIATDDAEARNVCSVIANSMVQKKRSFGGQWQLRVFAPDRAHEPLAACSLK